MPTITDWLMVVITVVYVIATIVISESNKTTAKAAIEEIKVSKEQFEEGKRLEAIPFLQIEYVSNKDFEYTLKLPLVPMTKGCFASNIGRVFRLKNVGRSTAKNLIYLWEYEGIKYDDLFPINAIMQGDAYNFMFVFGNGWKYEDERKGRLEIEYDDILGHHYHQKHYFSFGASDEIIIETDQPRYEGRYYE